MRTTICSLLVAGLLLGLTAVALGEEFDNPKVKIPPKGKPARISGGESFPPLPLPATPLRRTERKREPSPPALVGQIKFAKVAWKMVDGKRQAVEAYPSVKVDLEALMDSTNRQLKIKYKSQPASFEDFSYDPAELPILYFTGWKEFPGFDEKVRANLVRYLTDGGTMIINSSCGRPEFNNSVIKALGELFPNRQLAPLPADHPVYHCFHEIDQMHLREGKAAKTLAAPANLGVYGINIGSRSAVLFAPVDLSTGWDAAANPIEGGILYEQNDAVRLGSNMLTYSLASFEYARAFATEKVYFEKDDPTRDQLVLAQIAHNGDWDPTPHGLPNLLKFLQDNSTLNVQFKREVVRLTDIDVFKHPVLYITGLREFTLTPAETKQLGNYLRAGGVLLADAAIGSRTFDASFRKMIKEALPEAELQLLKPDHPLHAALFKAGQVELTGLGAKLYPELKQPVIEAVTLNGKVVVTYSRLSLGNGWEKLNFPYTAGYADADALKLGANAVIYAMTGH